MSNCLKFCSCRACKAGKRSKASKLSTRRVLRGTRRKNRVALKKGETEMIEIVSAPYTD